MLVWCSLFLVPTNIAAMMLEVRVPRWKCPRLLQKITSVPPLPRQVPGYNQAILMCQHVCIAELNINIVPVVLNFFLCA